VKLFLCFSRPPPRFLSVVGFLFHRFFRNSDGCCRCSSPFRSPISDTGLPTSRALSRLRDKRSAAAAIGREKRGGTKERASVIAADDQWS